MFLLKWLSTSRFFIRQTFITSFFLLFIFSCKSVDYLIKSIEGVDILKYSIFGNDEVDLSSLDKVDIKGFSIGDFRHPLVQQQLNAYQSKAGKQKLQAILNRGSIYIPTILKIFKAEGIPEDLAYLPIIESGYRTQVASHKKAVGMWQFIYTTGKYYGLDNDNYWYEDRCDPIKSTQAAALHFKYLYRIFGDWLLVLAAYNAGAGKIKRAIKRYGSRDFWQLIKYSYIRKETKNYVPKFIATSLIAKNPEKYGIKGFDDKLYVELQSYEVKDATDIKLLAKSMEMTESEFKLYNPALLKWATPPETAFKIHIPSNRYKIFTNHFLNIPKSERVTFRSYFINSGDNLIKIAKNFKVPVNSIVQLNKIKKKHRIQAGEFIIIPIRGIGKAAKISSKNLASYQLTKGEKVFFHEVSNDDTLYLISLFYDVPLSSLYLWNKLARKTSIRPGMLLEIRINE